MMGATIIDQAGKKLFQPKNQIKQKGHSTI